MKINYSVGRKGELVINNSETIITLYGENYGIRSMQKNRKNDFSRFPSAEISDELFKRIRDSVSVREAGKNISFLEEELLGELNKGHNIEVCRFIR